MQIGFRETTYSVVESAGEVTVTVSILTGGVSNNIVVAFETTERSAKGIHTTTDYIGSLYY